MAHVEELRKIGVPAPERVPSMYWVEPDRVKSDSLLWVVGESSSGEGEVFLARDEKGNQCVTVASDHTDRALETVSVAKAKQICSKIVAPVFWRVDEIREHWDSIELKTWADGKLYQEGTLGRMLPPEKLFELAREDSPAPGRISLFSGTLAVLGEGIVYASDWALSLRDPVLGREIRHEYTVRILPDRN
ncbi:MAG: DUF2848 family protein [Synergistaceae bacterium]|nr:DUF2848 family protein [Synergistaceae bacterium]